MKRPEDTAGPLDTAILHLFERAVAEGRLAVADHLMQALEELAASEPDCECLVQGITQQLAATARDSVSTWRVRRTDRRPLRS